MKEPFFLTLAEILEIHQTQIERFGGDAGLRDLGLLESAISMPQASFGGVYLHNSLFDMASAYAYHISENQPFVDGNKRTGLGTALIFLEMNGTSIKDPRGTLYHAMLKISNRKMSKSELAQALKKLAIKV